MFSKLKPFFAALLLGMYAGITIGAPESQVNDNNERAARLCVIYIFFLGGDDFKEIYADMPEILKELRPEQRKVVSLFATTTRITAHDVARTLKVSLRTAQRACQKFVKEGFLVVDSPARKNRTYRLHDRFREALVVK
jgi:hypothetical protein